jgi:hypothetical protein
MLALGLTLSACGPVELDSQGRPLAPPGQKKRLPIDWLLD